MSALVTGLQSKDLRAERKATFWAGVGLRKEHLLCALLLSKIKELSLLATTVSCLVLI